jgi:outer membrane protein OmpA-like peptidoglycan-associated protein
MTVQTQHRGPQSQILTSFLFAMLMAACTSTPIPRAADEGRLQSARAERERPLASNNQREADQANERAKLVPERVDELARALETTPGQRTERGLVLTVRDILFETNQTSLAEDAQRTADHLAEILRQHPKHRIRIKGFADARAREAYNLKQINRRIAVLFSDESGQLKSRPQ